MATNLMRGHEHLFNARLDLLFSIAIGATAATLRIRREETCHRLGLPSNSLVSLIEQERTKFDDDPSSRSRLSMSSWYLGDSREANLIRADTMRWKQQLKMANEKVGDGGGAGSTTNPTPPPAAAAAAAAAASFSSTALPPLLLSRNPQTGELNFGPSTTSDATAAEPPGGILASISNTLLLAGSPEASNNSNDDAAAKQRDAEFRRKFRETQPGVPELAMMFGGRFGWFAAKKWTEYWARPWFWTRWAKGKKSGWQSQRSDKALEAERTGR